MRVHVHTHALAEFFEFQGVVAHRGLATIPDLQDGVYEVSMYVHIRVFLHACLYAYFYVCTHAWHRVFRKHSSAWFYFI